MKKQWFKKRKSEKLYVDEVFFDSFRLNQKDLRWEERIEESVSPHLTRFFWFLAGILFLFFGGRVVYINVLKGLDFQAAAQENYIKEIWQKSGRGIIYSSNLEPLVKNVSIFNLVAIPAEIPREHEKQENIIGFLQKNFNKSRQEVVTLFQDINRFSFRPVPIFTDISQEQVLVFRSSSKSLPGLQLEENFKRQYSQGRYFSHVLGYAGLVSPEDLKKNNNYLLTDQVGKSGLEAFYEDELRGKYGKVEKEITSLGEAGREIFSSPAEPGKNLILFLNKGLQEEVGKIMERYLAERGFTKGVVVAMDPRSGGILALQSFPLYDSNVFSGRLSQESFDELFKNPDQPLFNRAVAGLYPSGSTIKPYIGTAALEEDIIDENTTVNVTGSITVAGQEFHDWRAHGIVNIRRAIEVSSNVFFYTVGGGYGDIDGLGPYLIKDYLCRFGLGALTNIDLPGEQKGIVPDPAWKKQERGEQWFIGDTYNTSIGQGDLLVTPLQMASALSALVNNGTLLKPRMVKAIANQDLTEFELLSPEIIRKNIASQESFKIIKEGMRLAVQEGSAIILESLPINVAGKTGTAQSYKDQDPHAWFTSFAPYENPEIVLVVMVENGGGGSQIAVPITYEILNWYFSR